WHSTTRHIHSFEVFLVDPRAIEGLKIPLSLKCFKHVSHVQPDRPLCVGLQINARGQRTIIVELFSEPDQWRLTLVSRCDAIKMVISAREHLVVLSINAKLEVD